MGYFAIANGELSSPTRSHSTVFVAPASGKQHPQQGKVALYWLEL
jgi:hypothetical protein